MKAIKSVLLLSCILALAFSLMLRDAASESDVSSVGFAIAWSPEPGPGVTSTATITVINNDGSTGVRLDTVSLQFSWGTYKAEPATLIEPKGRTTCQIVVPYPDPNLQKVDETYPFFVSIDYATITPQGDFKSGHRGMRDWVFYEDGYKVWALVVAPSSEEICVIATAAFGSELAPEVQFMRGFRDNRVGATFAGGNFVGAFNAWYYSWSPPVAQSISGSEPFRYAVRLALCPLVGAMHAAEAVFSALSFNPELAAVASVGAIAFLCGALYIAPLLLAVRLALYGFSAWRRHALILALIIPISGSLIALGEALVNSALVTIGFVAFALSAMTIGALIIVGFVSWAFARTKVMRCGN
jgi:hypothetical protein